MVDVKLTQQYTRLRDSHMIILHAMVSSRRSEYGHERGLPPDNGEYFVVVQFRTRRPDPRVTKAAFGQIAERLQKTSDQNRVYPMLLWAKSGIFLLQ